MNKRKLNPSTLFQRELGVQLEKLQLTEEASYSITKPDKAQLIHDIMQRHLNVVDKKKNIKECVITDATACVGGDTLQFSKYFQSVNAVEINPTHCKMLQNNIGVYKRKNVNVFCADYTKMYHTLQQDVVFMDPPWGGPSYKKKARVKLQLSNIPLYKIIQKISNRAKLIVLKTPTNFDMGSLFHYKSYYTQNPLYTSVHVYHLGNMNIIVLVMNTQIKRTTKRKVVS